jgi:hypothetical protein
MTTKTLCLVTMAALAGAAAAQTTPDEEKKLINTLMQRQDVIAVNDVASAEGFVPDNDPNTLQVVILTGPNAKPSVSDDGEVVFFAPGLSTNQQGNLTYEAFRRKAKRILAVKVPPLPNPQ